jgi:hypothetical protein
MRNGLGTPRCGLSGFSLVLAARLSSGNHIGRRCDLIARARIEALTSPLTAALYAAMSVDFALQHRHDEGHPSRGRVARLAAPPP